MTKRGLALPFVLGQLLQPVYPPCTMELLTVGVLLLLEICVPVPLPHTMLLVMLGEEELALSIPPPKEAELPVKVVLVMLGEEELLLNIPPPLLEAELPVKVALMILGEEDWLNVPPP